MEASGTLRRSRKISGCMRCEEERERGGGRIAPSIPFRYWVRSVMGNVRARGVCVCIPAAIHSNSSWRVKPMFWVVPPKSLSNCKLTVCL